MIKPLLQSVLRQTYRWGIVFIPSRGELPYVLNARGLCGRGVEVGVKHGQFSEYVLDLWKGQVLYSVDPWREDAPGQYVDVANVPQDEQERFYRGTVARLSRFGARSRIMRCTSAEAAPSFEDGSLDFVYIDARHDYEHVREDIGLWSPKVRPGGILGGHDYLSGLIDGTTFGVKDAVDEFARGAGLRLLVTRGDYPSWFVLKD